MNSMSSPQPGTLDSPRAVVLPTEPALPPLGSSTEGTFLSPELGPRRVGYGLPCAKCKTYYAADLSACPVCHTAQRVSPTLSAATNPVPRAPQAATPAPDEAALEEERERFLRDFKAQVYESDEEGDPTATFGCSLNENHEESFEPATVCQGCFERLQQRVDVLEAALHMDLRDATQLIYDAVWSDPSDPSKTYQNAAQAILTELRNRAGISAVLGSLQPLAH